MVANHHNVSRMTAVRYFIFSTFILSFSLNISGAPVSFFVPETHEKYKIIDSLFNIMTKQESRIDVLEKALIKKKEVLNEPFTVKVKYFDYLLQYRLSTKEKIFEYCQTLKTCLETRMTYFQTLLSAVEDDSRPKCFMLWKKAQKEFSDAVAAVNKYDDAQLPPKIELGNNEIFHDNAAHPSSKATKNQ